jgi:ATP-binding cassette subfamily F protein uup
MLFNYNVKFLFRDNDLEKEQKQIEEELCSGNLSIEELTEKSKRLPQIKDILDEKGMRWLELSEYNV